MRIYTKLGPLLAAVAVLALLASGQVSTYASTPPAALNTNAGTEAGDDLEPHLTTDDAGNWVAVWASLDGHGAILTPIGR